MGIMVVWTGGMSASGPKKVCLLGPLGYVRTTYKNDLCCYFVDTDNTFDPVFYISIYLI